MGFRRSSVRIRPPRPSPSRLAAIRPNAATACPFPLSRLLSVCETISPGRANGGQAAMAMGSTEYILAIDLGTGGPKVALISADGEIAGHEFEATTLHLTPDGGAEQDPDDWWRALTTAARRLLARGLVPPERIVALSCTTQWMGTVPVDRDGNHLTNAII